MEDKSWGWTYQDLDWPVLDVMKHYEMDMGWSDTRHILCFMDVGEAFWEICTYEDMVAEFMGGGYMMGLYG